MHIVNSALAAAVAAALLTCAAGARAQPVAAFVVPACDAQTLSTVGPDGRAVTQDTAGNLCVSIKPSALTPLSGTQMLALTSVAQSLTVPAGATSATLSVTGNPAIYRDDGTPPTGSAGMTLPVGLWTYAGSLTALQFILPTGITGTVVTAAFYK